MNYKKVKERMERKEEAVKKLIEFLGTEDSYSDMLGQMAMAQTTIMQLMDISKMHGYSESTETITIFFSTIQCLLIQIEDLSNFAQLEHEED